MISDFTINVNSSVNEARNGTSPEHSDISQLDPQEVRACLHRILSSEHFPASDRNRRFLAHLVENALIDPNRRIRSYEIATKVFGRPATFNPTTDPIIRIEAGKLRRGLDFYYLQSGRADHIRIQVPRGKYRAVFLRKQAESVVANPGHGDNRGVTVHAWSMDVAAAGLLGDGFRGRIVDHLARRPGICVFAALQNSLDGDLLDSESVRLSARQNQTAYVYSGEVVKMAEVLRATGRIYDGTSGRLLWSEDINLSPEDAAEVLARRFVEVREKLGKNHSGGVV